LQFQQLWRLNIQLCRWQCVKCFLSENIVASHSTHFRTTVHEDNARALALANMEPGRITPRSKHYAVKMHWFRSKLDPNGSHPITIKKIDTQFQRGRYLHQRPHKEQVSGDGKVFVRLVNFTLVCSTLSLSSLLSCSFKPQWLYA
jgi:hypothetical protein